MRAAPVLVVVAVLVAGIGIGDAVASSKPTHISACVNSAGKIVGASGKHCGHGAHSVALPTTAGVPASIPSVVPSGKTLRGVWQISGYATAATQYTDTQVSFDYPFATAPAPIIVTASSNQDPAACKGSVANPTAAKGFVCVYVTSETNIAALSTVSAVTNVVGQATRFGWGMYETTAGAGNIVVNGTWAATAK
jgi:hypothetical protein